MKVFYIQILQKEDCLDIDEIIQNEIKKISIYNVLHEEVFSSNKYEQRFKYQIFHPNVVKNKYIRI
jgi:hypothetical protein